ALLGPTPRVLEIGTGTGRDADLLERRGASVVRTDAATSFVRRLRAGDHQADVVNVLTDDLGGPYDGVFANAVLLHLRRAELPGVLARLHDAVRPGGVGVHPQGRRGRRLVAGEARATAVFHLLDR
ncbi:MAG: class I SAM-dependent methyltransferase, partial [Mycobacterium sp.]|nr:class I SAM-dependent methyltransferase [Mycobacterium sp.]